MWVHEKRSLMVKHFHPKKNFSSKTSDFSRDLEDPKDFQLSQEEREVNQEYTDPNLLLEKLAQLMGQFSLKDVHYRKGDLEIHMTRQDFPSTFAPAAYPLAGFPAGAYVSPPYGMGIPARAPWPWNGAEEEKATQASLSSEAPKTEASSQEFPSHFEKSKPNYQSIKAQLVGTVYLSPKPGSPPFVNKGDFVKKGQTLLIIEAMKVMNPIKSPWEGVVEEILVSDAFPVEYGEELMRIS